MSSSGNPAPSSGQYPGNQRQPPGGRAWRSGSWQDPPRLSGRVLASGYGQGERYARFSGLPPRQDHPGASRAARLRRQPPGGPAAPGSCAGKPGSCAGKPGSCAGKPGSCAGKRSRSWPGSALTTTPGLNAAGHPASESVLEGIARALHPDEAERAHLFDLARAAAVPAALRAPSSPSLDRGTRIRRCGRCWPCQMWCRPGITRQ
jgi:hypothetical protein